MQPEQIERILDRVLMQVEKPGRYVGGEYNSIVKDWDAIDVKVAFAFPDIYDLGHRLTLPSFGINYGFVRFHR